MEIKLTPEQHKIVERYREIHTEISELESSIASFFQRIEELNLQLEELRTLEKNLENNG